MGQPKAKWECSPNKNNADCRVGPFNLEAHVHRSGGKWAVFGDDLLTSADVVGPCDIVDLMLLAEAELERRLRGAAETMDGKELVAEDANAPKCTKCGARAPERYRGKRVITCPECSDPPKYAEHVTLGITGSRASAEAHQYTSDKTPVGTVERVNDDGTVLVRVGGSTNLFNEYAARQDKRLSALMLGPDEGSLAWALAHLRAGRECTDCFGVTYRMVSEGRYSYRQGSGASQRGGTCDKLPNKDGWKLADAAEGSREWAIEQMAAGQNCTDSDGDVWWREGIDYFCSATNGEHGQRHLPPQPDFDRGWK